MTNTVAVRLSDKKPYEQEIVEYRKRKEGWYIYTESIDGIGWRLFDNQSAREIDVEQLIRKEYDCRY